MLNPDDVTNDNVTRDTSINHDAQTVEAGDDTDEQAAGGSASHDLAEKPGSMVGRYKLLRPERLVVPRIVSTIGCPESSGMGAFLAQIRTPCLLAMSVRRPIQTAQPPYGCEITLV